MNKRKKSDNWKKDMLPYETPSMKHSLWQLVNTTIPFFALWYLSYLSLHVSYLLALIPAIVAGGFLVRIFIIFHDCCHLSFFRNRKANEIVGTITGILTFVPYMQWKYSHSVHHATSSNLSKRGTGDIWTLTVDEYLAAPRLLRLWYRFYRNPLVMFGLGPIYIFLIQYRFNRKAAKMKERVNTYITNIGIVGISVLLSWLIGWQAFLLVQGTIFFVSGVAGVWLFYVQHQFEPTYYEEQEEWDYVKAALEGSSFYKLPKVLQWMTGNIGFHHVHHLSPRVPNYYLERAHTSQSFLQRARVITMLTSLRSLRYRLWSEKKKTFLSFKDIKMLRRVKQ
ncbi:fatty acid desaturase [Longirhabdus pacifica]|uniref:fatty acid desaturase n=1 Tax=Longirhabdus pacifica TaxID=2305227 RepID=UPI0010090212|nr:fatty acid desaturase [Longirhabdus pacifica]